MSFNGNISVRWDLSPRLITLSTLDTEITIQDLHDTLRELESRSANMIYPSLCSTTGKEDLGGGTTVGLTMVLLNARIAFQSRYTNTSTGTSTAVVSAPATVLTDTSATFVSDGVLPGATITSFDDQAFATVISVLDEENLQTEPLTDGSTNAWGIGDTYKVHNEIQVNVSGGNLVAVDDLGADLDPVFPTFATQVVRTSSASATLQELADIQFGAYNQRVTVDVANTSGNAMSGTVYPTGSPRQPSDNLADALAIQAAVGLPKVMDILGDITIDAGLNYDSFRFQGESKTKSTITVSAAASVIGCEFVFCTITGRLDGGSSLFECDINPSLNYVDGFVENCIIEGTITLSGSGEAHFVNCKGGLTVLNPAVIDMGGSGSAMIIASWEGGLTLINKTGPEEVEIDMLAGHIEIHSTVTNGAITLRGTGVVDHSGSTATIDAFELVSGSDIHVLKYAGAIHIHEGGTTGETEKGNNGTPLNPVGNTADALVLSAALGIQNLAVRGLVVTTDDFPGYVFQSHGQSQFVVIGSDCDSSQFINMAVVSSTFAVGLVGGSDQFAFKDSITAECVNIKGVFLNHRFLGKNTFTAGSTNFISGGAFDERDVALVPQLSPAELDVNGSSITAQDIHGDFILSGVNLSTSLAVIGMSSGVCTVDSTCTDGTVIVKGAGTLVDNSAAGCTVIDETIGHAADYTSPIGPAIWISQFNGTPGTVPGVNGTAKSPVTNEADAWVLSQALGYPRYYIASGNHTLVGGGSDPADLRDYQDFTFKAASHSAGITGGGKNVWGSTFLTMRVLGTFDAYGDSIDNGGLGQNGFDVVCTDCAIGAVTDLTGAFENCEMHSTITMPNTVIVSALGTAGGLTLSNCHSANAAEFPTRIVMGDTVKSQVRLFDYDGKVIFQQINNTGTVLEFSSGSGSDVEFDSSTTISGLDIPIKLDGSHRFTDNSTLLDSDFDHGPLHHTHHRVEQVHRFRGLKAGVPFVAAPGTHSSGGKTVTIVESPPGTFTTTTSDP